MTSRWLALALVLVPAAVRADGASEEIAVGGTPEASWISDKVGGVWDASDVLSISLDFAATHTEGDVVNTSLALDYTIDDHWAVHAALGWSPESETFATEVVDIGADMLADARLRAASSSMSAGAGVAYETAGDSDRELAAGVAVNATYFQSQQEITSVRDASGQMYGIEQLRAACATGVCDRELAGALWPQWAQLGQFAIDGNISETVDGNTDLGLDGAYYLYDRDPQQVGYFVLATIGRGTLGSAAGVAPSEFAVTPSVSHRWGALAATASVGYSSYLEHQGYELGASLRIHYKLALDDHRRVKLYGKLGSSWHVNSTNELARSGSLSLGIQYTW